MKRGGGALARRWPAVPAAWSTTLLLAGAFALLGPRLLVAVAPGLALDAPRLAARASLALVAARWLQGLPEGFARARRARSEGRGWPVQALRSVVPAEVAGALACLGWAVAGCVAGALNRPAPPRPEGLRLEDRRKGLYDTVFILNLLSIVVEVPLMWLLMRGGAWPSTLQAAMHGLEVAMVVLVLGDRWLVRAGGHVLTSTHLDLRAGVRAGARVPLAAIERIEPLPRTGGPWAWRRAKDVARAEIGTVSVLDTPNLAITLREDALGGGLSWTRFQAERPMPRHLLVYVDDPAAVAAAVRAAAPPLH